MEELLGDMLYKRRIRRAALCICTVVPLLTPDELYQTVATNNELSKSQQPRLRGFRLLHYWCGVRLLATVPCGHPQLFFSAALFARP